jgi:hypothetical protein
MGNENPVKNSLAMGLGSENPQDKWTKTPLSLV